MSIIVQDEKDPACHDQEFYRAPAFVICLVIVVPFKWPVYEKGIEKGLSAPRVP
jgi:hypothetical protein